MRGIYNLKTLKYAGDAPIFRKVLGTFLATSLISSVIAGTILLGLLKQQLTIDQAIWTTIRVAYIWFATIFVHLMVLWKLLKNSVSPLVQIATSAKNLRTIDEIDLPSDCSLEIQSIYKIVNESLIRLKRIQQQTIEAERNAAVAQLTQMLAHDVRRPLSILELSLTMIKTAQNMVDVKHILNRVTPEVARAVKSVNGLIADVLEIGAQGDAPISEEVTPESLIEATLSELCRMNSKVALEFVYEFSHTQKLMVQVLKIMRVFANIVGNAAQATKFKDKIWFKTKDILVSDAKFIQFCIGNSGSFISEDSLSKIFEPFFTSGKTNGTGLGLAIAHKIVTAHGGTIWCESKKTPEFPDGQVEFYFTLPAHESKCEGLLMTLPKNSAELVKNLTAQSSPANYSGTSESALEMEIINKANDLNRTINILLVDDEAIYRQALAEILSRTPELTKSLKVEQAETCEDALEFVNSSIFDFIITDIDMGPGAANGIELIKKIRNLQTFSGSFVIHSNRCYEQKLTDTEALKVLPKPVARAELLATIVQALN